MSVPIIRQYNSLSEEKKAKVNELIERCDAEGVANLLSQYLARRVSEKEANYLVLELNPACGKPKEIRIDTEKYYKQVDLAKELDFIYNFEKERLIVSRQLEKDSGEVPLTITDKIIEVLVKILELRMKVAPQSNVVDELKKLLEEAGEG